MAGVNKVILVGNLGRDPEIRNLDNGVKLARFSLATTESYRDRDGNRVDKTEWHNIVLWRGLADVAEKYLQKGNQVYIEGKLQTRQWQDQDGNTRYTTEIVGDNMTMLGSRRDPANSTPMPEPPMESHTASEKQEEENIEMPDDDLPF